MVSAERRKRILDKASLWVVAIAVFLAVVGLSLGLWQTQQNHTLALQNQALTKKLITSGNNHHDATVKQNNLIVAQQNEITGLLNQHTTTFSQLATFEATIIADFAFFCPQCTPPPGP